MDCCSKLCGNSNNRVVFIEDYADQLRKKEIYLKHKEKELIKRDKHLNKKINKRRKSYWDIKSDVKTINDLRKETLRLQRQAIKLKKQQSSKKKNKEHEPNLLLKLIFGKSKLNKCKLFSDYEQWQKRHMLRNQCMAAFNRVLGSSTGNYSFSQPCICSTRRPVQKRGNASGDCYLMSLRKTPHVGIYHRWPQFYPHYLNARAQIENVKCVLLFILGIIIWTPCFILLGICKCCYCFCCSDCS